MVISFSCLAPFPNLHKFEDFICVSSDHPFRLWVNKSVPEMTFCYNDVITSWTSSTVYFSKYSVQQRGQGDELIRPVQNRLTLVSLVSIFWHIFPDTLSGFISIWETRVLSLNWLGFLSSMICFLGQMWGDWIVYAHLCWSILTALFPQTGQFTRTHPPSLNLAFPQLYRLAQQL